MRKLWIIIMVLMATTAKASKVILAGYIEQTLPHDSLTLIWWDLLCNEQQKYNLPHHEQTLRLLSGTHAFRFMLDTIASPIYFSLGRKDSTGGFTPLLDEYPAEPGDSVSILYPDREQVSFYGKGVAKYRCRFMLDKQTLYATDQPDTIGCMDVLNQYRPMMTIAAYGWLKADVLGKYNFWQCRQARFRFLSDKKINTAVNEILFRIPAPILALSRNWRAYLVEKALLEEQRFNGQQQAFNILKNNPASLRGPLLATFLSLCWNNLHNPDSLLDITLPFALDKGSKIILSWLGQSLAAGSPAYDFSLPGEDDNIVSLHEFKGKLVFIDFWYAACSSCREYYRDVVSKAEKAFKDSSSIMFVSISIDTDKELWLKSIRQHLMKQDNMVNLYTGGIGENDKTIRAYRIASYPRPVLVDRHGKVITANEQELRLGGAAALNKLIRLHM